MALVPGQGTKVRKNGRKTDARYRGELRPGKVYEEKPGGVGQEVRFKKGL